MALALKRTYELLALRVAIRIVDGEWIDFALEYHGRQDSPEVGRWSVALPWPRTSPSDVEGALLASLAEKLPDLVGAADVPPELPIWLHLAKPYGRLGSVPWEAALERVSGRAVLRLPDFLERPREARDALDVAVCSDAPAGEAAGQLSRLVEGILHGSSRRRTRVHVLATPANAAALRERHSKDVRVRVPPPMPRSDESAPWLLDMSGAFEGRAVDVVHFVCHATGTSDRPSLVLADPSGGDAPALVRFVSVNEVAAALSKVGAWGAAFTAPAGAAEADVRWFADALAQSRPGVVAYDPGDRAAAQYRFLADAEPGTVPLQAPGFVYCQPSFAMRASEVASQVPAVAQNAHLFVAAPTEATPVDGRRASPDPGGEPPSPHWAPAWVAAAQRFVEAATLDLLRKGADDPLMSDRVRDLVELAADPEEPPRPVAGADGIVGRTLSELQSIVARHFPGAER